MLTCESAPPRRPSDSAPDMLSMNHSSCATVGRSVTDYRHRVGFHPGSLLRHHQPSACRARATRSGMPQRFLGLSPAVRLVA
jgi:hypothetical protein